MAGTSRLIRLVAALGFCCLMQGGALALSISPRGRSSTASDTIAADARIEFDPRFDRLVYQKPLAQSESVAADGAAGTNIAWDRHLISWWYIEEQDHADEAIIGGLARHEPRVWRAGLREYDWGFAHQAPDGSFAGTLDAFHSTSFFVAAAAHTILVLRHAHAAGMVLPRVVLACMDRYLRRLHAAAAWMARPTVWDAGLAGDSPYTHRRYFVADAVGLTGVLNDDGRLIRRADQVLTLGLRAQRSDGVNPELGVVPE